MDKEIRRPRVQVPCASRCAYSRFAVVILFCLCLALRLHRAHGGQTDPPPGPYLQVGVFSALSYSEGTVVEWRTDYELDVIGFYLYRQAADGEKIVRLGKGLLPGLLTEPGGGRYMFVDTTTPAYAEFGYTLEVVAASGGRRRYGPVTSTAVPRSAKERPIIRPDGDGCYVRSPHPVPEDLTTRSALAADSHSAARKLREVRRGQRLKIEAGETGIYGLGAAVVAERTGMSEAEVAACIASRSWRLTRGGHRVAWVPYANGAGMYFFNRRPDSLYTDYNIFWLERGNGIVVSPAEGIPPLPSVEEQTFIDTVSFEYDRYAATGIFSDPEEDYWFWAFVYGGQEGTNFSFRLSGVDTTTNGASLTVRLQGVSDSGVAGEHHAKFSLNGVPVGETIWQGLNSTECTMSFEQPLLSNGVNVLDMEGLLAPGVPHSVFYMGSFDVTYRRGYVADGNIAIFNSGTNTRVTVRGFTSNDVQVLDISDESMPRVVHATSVTESNAAFSVTFDPGQGMRFVAFTSDGALRPSSVWADEPSSLRSATNAANYLVITRADFAEAAERLRAYRETNGWQTALVLLEDVYDEFSRGVSTPHAVRGFLRHAHTYWKQPPTHVVLAGEGTYDYRDRWGTGECVVPVLMRDTPYRLFASDNAFGDILGGDGVPEIAMGRLPAATSGELALMIDKTIAFEGAEGGAWTQTVVMAADNVDGGGDYPADSDVATGFLPVGGTTEKIYLSDHSVGDARALILNALQSGASMLHYIGNCGWDRLASEGLLTRTDVGALTNAPRLMATVGITCFLNRFEVPRHDFLGEELLLREGGGAVCVWGATGLSINDYGRTLDHGFLRARYADGHIVAGDAVKAALVEYGRSGRPRFMLDIYVLLGDPALRLR